MYKHKYCFGTDPGYRKNSCLGKIFHHSKVIGKDMKDGETHFHVTLA